MTNKSIRVLSSFFRPISGMDTLLFRNNTNLFTISTTIVNFNRFLATSTLIRTRSKRRRSNVYGAINRVVLTTRKMARDISYNNAKDNSNRANMRTYDLRVSLNLGDFKVVANFFSIIRSRVRYPRNMRVTRNIYLITNPTLGNITRNIRANKDDSLTKRLLSRSQIGSSMVYSRFQISGASLSFLFQRDRSNIKNNLNANTYNDKSRRDKGALIDPRQNVRRFLSAMLVNLRRKNRLYSVRRKATTRHCSRIYTQYLRDVSSNLYLLVKELYKRLIRRSMLLTNLLSLNHSRDYRSNNLSTLVNRRDRLYTILGRVHRFIRAILTSRSHAQRSWYMLLRRYLILLTRSSVI